MENGSNGKPRKGKRRALGRQLPSLAPPAAQGCSWPRAHSVSKFWFSSGGWFRHGPYAIATCSWPFLLSAEQEGRARAGNACRPCFPQRGLAPVRVRWGLGGGDGCGRGAPRTAISSSPSQHGSRRQTGRPGGLPSMGLQSVGHDSVTGLSWSQPGSGPGSLGSSPD